MLEVALILHEFHGRANNKSHSAFCRYLIPAIGKVTIPSPERLGSGETREEYICAHLQLARHSISDGWFICGSDFAVRTKLGSIRPLRGTENPQIRNLKPSI